jgi:KUP system potassium uptake protein
MIATSVLFANFLVFQRRPSILIYLYLLVYLSIEGSFLYANMEKFPHGGFVSVVLGGVLFLIMFNWFRARKIKNRYVEFVKLEPYIAQLRALSNDLTVPKYGTHLVYLTSANNPKEIEHKIIYSIMVKKPKRADVYWLLHVDTVDDPYTMEYMVDHIASNDVIRVEFRLGFRVQPRLHLMFQKVAEDLMANNEVDITSRYKSLEESNIVGDFTFVVMEKYLSQDNELPLWDRLMMHFHFLIRDFSLSEPKAFGLDTGNVVVEKFPLVVAPVKNIKLKRIFHGGS